MRRRWTAHRRSTRSKWARSSPGAWVCLQHLGIPSTLSHSVSASTLSESVFAAWPDRTPSRPQLGIRGACMQGSCVCCHAQAQVGTPAWASRRRRSQRPLSHPQWATRTWCAPATACRPLRPPGLPSPMTTSWGSSCSGKHGAASTPQWSCPERALQCTGPAERACNS
jgi:hypothetical protein